MASQGPNKLTLNVRGPSYLGLTRSISWLLMPWLLMPTPSNGRQTTPLSKFRYGREILIVSCLHNWNISILEFHFVHQRHTLVANRYFKKCFFFFFFSRSYHPDLMKPQSSIWPQTPSNINYGVPIKNTLPNRSGPIYRCHSPPPPWRRILLTHWGLVTT